jgi:shikimate dehydrogenase
LTLLYGVIGDPIRHSMSPLMHNDQFQQMGLDAYYHPFHVKKEHLKEAVMGMKALGVQGFNVTIPHKTAIMNFLDNIDPLAEAIGAVNTVVRDGERFVGYNTDGVGFVQALKEDYRSELTNEKILIIGAGGAARAIYYTLAKERPLQIDLANRTIEKAEKLIRACPFPVQSSAYSIHEAEKHLADYTVIVQTTSIGMYPQQDALPISLERVTKQTFLSDIVYNPLQTKFLQEGAKNGLATQNGVGMFVYQGALAFQLWTGKKPNIERMKSIVIQQLGG